MDGVIADTMKYHFLANQKIATELNIPFNEKDNDEFKGMSRKEIIRNLVKKSGNVYNEEEIEELSERKNEYYKKYLDHLSEDDVLPGIFQLLEKLKEQKIKMAVASSSTNAVTVLKKIGVYDFFDHVVDVKKLKHGKPHPEVFLTAADKINVPYENCVALEDGKLGLQAIFKAKMFSIGVGTDKFMSLADWHINYADEICLNVLFKKFIEIPEKSYLIGVDGGGTYTRAVLCDERGRTLSSIKIEGGAHPGKNKNAKTNIKNAIHKVIENTEINMNEISIVVCGIAGLNNENDLEWAREFTEIEDLKCPKIHLNDAVVARKGAFEDGLGIIAIAGTGSIVIGYGKDDEMIRNYDFDHLAYAGSRFLSVDVIYEIISENYAESDFCLVEKVLKYWNLDSVDELRKLVLDNFSKQDVDFTKRLSSMTSIITFEANNGSIIAQKVCYKAMYNLSLGVKLVGNTLSEFDIKVTAIGGVVKDIYMKQIFIGLLYSKNKNYVFQEPVVSSAYGSILIGAEKLGIELNLVDLCNNNL
jgi:glucosamine kinase